MQINPAILTGDIETFIQQLALVRDFSTAELVQIDIIDGLFSNNVTITPTDLALADLDFARLKLDFHLMTEEPMDYVWELVEHQQSFPIRAVYGQIEKMSHQTDFLEEVKKQGWQAGLALNLFTPISSIEQSAWNYLDEVLLMAVEAGAQGRVFNNLVLEKIKELCSQAQQLGRTIKIVVDGGVKAEHLAILKSSGVDRVAIGSALFSVPDFITAFASLNKEVL